MSMRTAQSNDYLPANPNASGETLPGYDEGEALSLIDRYSVFEGIYRSSRDLRIEGEVRGTIECNGTLHVAQGANVDAKVEAESISVAGELSGEILCRGRLQLMPTGRLKGKVTTQTLVINEGAIYEGQLEMLAPDTSKRLGSSGSAPRPIASITGGTVSPPAEQPAQAIPAETRRRAESPAVTTGQATNGNTFIRRLGGPETTWDGKEDSEEDSENDEK